MIGLLILLTVIVVLFMLTRLVAFSVPRISMFEVERRIATGDERALKWGERKRAAPIVRTVRAFVGLVLALAMNAVLWVLLGGWLAALLTVAIVLASGWLRRIRPFRRFGEWLGVRVEPALLWLYPHRAYFGFLPVPKPVESRPKLHSEAELLHALDGASFLTPERRTLVRSALEFTGLTVADAMSGRRSIRAVDKGDVLGPLVLDELYKTGKRAFVVTDGGVDAVVGILGLDHLTNLDLKDSPTALAAMDPDVHFVDAGTPVTDALRLLRESKTPFLIVQDDGKTVGLVSMDNIIRCLFEV